MAKKNLFKSPVFTIVATVIYGLIKVANVVGDGFHPSRLACRGGYGTPPLHAPKTEVKHCLIL